MTRERVPFFGQFAIWPKWSRPWPRKEKAMRKCGQKYGSLIKFRQICRVTECGRDCKPPDGGCEKVVQPAAEVPVLILVSAQLGGKANECKGIQ